ncbi:MAG: hypothetical protein U0Q03_02840 [Acidimicrobiales bacterium]
MLFRDRRDRLALIWLAVVFGWSVLRCIAVAEWLSSYGVDPVWYLVIDLSSSLPYGLCSARLLGALFDGRRRAAVGWAIPTLAAFIAPDVYIFASGHALPWLSYVVVLGIAGIASALAVRSGKRSLEQKRRAAELEALEAAGTPGAPVL